jgi:hypothetical protein
MWGDLFDETTGLLFTIAAGPRQRSNFWVRVPHDSWLYFTLSDLRFFQPGGEFPVFIPPRNTVARLCSPALSSFRRLLRLTGLRWRYSNAPPRGLYLCILTNYSKILWAQYSCCMRSGVFQWTDNSVSFSCSVSIFKSILTTNYIPN